MITRIELMIPEKTIPAVKNGGPPVLVPVHHGPPAFTRSEMADAHMRRQQSDQRNEARPQGGAVAPPVATAEAQTPNWRPIWAQNDG